MEIELIQKILPLDCGKTGKLVLLIMAAHLSEKQWFVKDLMEIIAEMPRRFASHCVSLWTEGL